MAPACQPTTNSKLRVVSRASTDLAGHARGITVKILYSDHDHQLILVVDDIAKGRAVSEAWTREQV
jgi:signal transduction histidine kinase